jgi:hypothetical protein
METKKTEYRSISNGYIDFLQYRRITKYLFGLFKRKSWKYVPFPSLSTLDFAGYKTFVNTNNTKLEAFIKKWPNIKDYLIWAKEEQKRLEKKEAEKAAELKAKKGVIKILN